MKVKALSFRQPWAALILEGRKPLDLRTWSTRYRGPLAIYASHEIEKDACQAHGLDPQVLSTGVVIGLVELVEIIPLDEKTYVARRAEHLACRPFRPGLYGWILSNPRLVDPPIVVKGQVKLFDVVIDDGHLNIDHKPLTVSSEQLSDDVQKPTSKYSQSTDVSEYELRVVPELGDSYRLVFIQTLVESNPIQMYLYHQPPVKTRVNIELSGNTLRAVADVILDALRQNGYKPTDLNARHHEPFHLDEQTGVRLGLTFLAVKPITKTNRIETISQGIRGMAAEELYYWYSKCTGGMSAERAQRALRILLSGE